MPRAENGWKVCARCRRNFPVSEYHSDQSRVDGLYRDCRRCWSETKGKPPQWLNVQEFIKLYPKTPLRELAAYYCRTEFTIRDWAKWLRNNGYSIPFHHNRGGGGLIYNKREYAEFADGKAVADIADKFGIAASTVLKRNAQCRKEGYIIRTPKGYYK